LAITRKLRLGTVLQRLLTDTLHESQWMAKETRHKIRGFFEDLRGEEPDYGKDLVIDSLRPDKSAWWGPSARNRF